MMQNCRMAGMGSLQVLVIFSVLGTSVASAELIPTSAIVKVTSKLSGTQRVWNGSGFLFRARGHYYVVTSDHVSFHSTDLAKTTISNQSARQVGVNYIASDWGYGLTLLSVPAVSAPIFQDQHIPDLENLPTISPPIGTSVVVGGYPANSLASIIDRNGTVTSSGSHPFDFALVPSLLEVTNAHGEFGMSGGPAFTDEGGFVGILSHQYLLPNPGQPEHPRNELLIIPANDVVHWLRRYFSNPAGFVTYFFQDVDLQLDAEHTVYNGGIYLWLVEVYGLPDRKLAYVGLANENPSRFLPSTEALLDPLVRYFEQGSAQSGTIHFFRKKVPNCPRVRCWENKRVFRSAAEYTSLLQDMSLEPVIHLTVPGEDQDRLKADLNSISHRIKEAMDRLPQNLELSSLPLLHALDAMIPLFFERSWGDEAPVSEPAWTGILDKDLTQLLSSPEYAVDWATLSRYPAAARSLRADLSQLIIRFSPQMYSPD